MSFPQQSPINLKDPIFAELGDQGLEIHWEGVIPGHVIKEEHGLKVAFDPDYRQFVRLGDRDYHLVSFHFHHPSEHWVEGEQQTVELHVVHQNVNDATLAVVGIFIEVDESAASCPDLVPQLRTFLNAPPDQEAATRVKADPLQFLPERWEEYYRYEGSLTTPEFSENVSWVVVRDPFPMKAQDLKALIFEFEKPARFPEPLNRRFVLATFRPGVSQIGPAKKERGTTPGKPKKGPKKTT